MVDWRRSDARAHRGGRRLGPFKVSDVHARTVDPRDETWEIDRPRYRVYFHDRQRASFEYEIEGADVADVISWAESERRGRSYVLYVCTDVDGLGLLRLAGRDPNAGS